MSLIAKTEMTWGKWQAVRTWAIANGYDLADAGAGNGNMFPVTNVSWYQVVKWCNARSEMEGLTPVYTVNGTIYRSDNFDPVVVPSANGYRLPGEAEWEFAARGGVSSQGYMYSGSNDADAVAWNSPNSGGTIHGVATRSANELGLFDMSGNVSEWCYNWYTGYDDLFRVNRGGSWLFPTNMSSLGYPGLSNTPSSRISFIGFRLARSSAQ